MYAKAGKEKEIACNTYHQRDLHKNNELGDNQKICFDYPIFRGRPEMSGGRGIVLWGQ